MTDIDLDIQNYTIKDLEKFFKLKPGYSIADIDLKSANIRELLLKSGHIQKQYKADLIEFIAKAKEWLIFVKYGAPVAPTSLPREPRLDKTEYKDPPTGEKEANILKRPTTPYINTFSSEYYEGTINPLATRTIKQCLTIDTRFRDNFYTTQSSDFTFQLPLKFSKVVSMQLSSLEIPVAFYGTSASYGNTHLWLEIEYSDASSSTPLVESRVFRIADGNYNALDFIDALNNAIAPKDASGNIASPSDIFTKIRFSLNINQTGSGTGKVQINAASPIMRLKMDFARDVNGHPDNGEIYSKIGWNLGFTKRMYDGTTNYIADTIIEPATIRYIYLAVEDFNHSSNNHFITAFNQSFMSPHVLARISMRGNYFSLLMDNDLNIVTEPRKYFGPVDIQKLRIRLYDDFGRILDMNNANFSFCLVFTVLYDI